MRIGEIYRETKDTIKARRNVIQILTTKGVRQDAH